MKWLKDAFMSFFSHEKRYKLISLEDLPENNNFKREVVYWIGENQNKWSAAFMCPCGCKEIIYLNLLPKGSPCWKIIVKSNRDFSISPSINRNKGCKSHFFINDNKVVWA